MMKIYPSFFYDFRCKAENCTHSCCKNWEVDVDEASFLRYSELRGDFGERLRGLISTDENGVHSFRLREDGSCPLLRADGLCELILTLGEDALCDICYLHPRFYEEVGDAELAGLGLSCEASAELLLGAPLRFTLEIQDGEETELGFGELLKRLEIPFPKELLTFEAGITEEDLRELKEALRDDDPISPDWNDKLDGLTVPSVQKATPPVYGDVYRYFLYRQLERLSNGETSPRALASYAKLLTRYALLRDLRENDLPRCLAEVSEEVEYSTDRVETLLARYAEQTLIE